MLSGLLLVLGQVCLLLLSAAGYGRWLWLIAGQPRLGRQPTWLWLALGGFAAHALLLQALVYAGLPLRLTAWPAFLLGLAGLLVLVRGARRKAGKWACGDAVLYGAVLAMGVVGQAPGLLRMGPANLGMAIVAKTPMRATTNINSISEKPDVFDFVMA